MPFYDVHMDTVQAQLHKQGFSQTFCSYVC